MLNKILEVSPLGWIARLGNALMVPLMYILSGTVWEKPQQTHAWDVRRLIPYEAGRLSDDAMVSLRAIEGTVARPHRLSARFHAPIFGGWRGLASVNEWGVVKMKIRPAAA